MGLLTAVICLVLAYIGYKLIKKLLKIPQISDLDSRYILITGCDTGFGNATAKRLDALRCHVIAACLTESGETELRKSCSNKLHTIHLDVSNTENVKKAYQEVVKILPSGKGRANGMNVYFRSNINRNYFLLKPYNHNLILILIVF